MTIGHAMPLRKMFIDKQLQASIETARPDLARCRFSGLRRKVQHDSRHINSLSSVTHQDVPFAVSAVQKGQMRTSIPPVRASVEVLVALRLRPLEARR